MRPELFEYCIKYIKKKFDVHILEDIVLADVQAKNKESLATISFDDGYKDNIDYAIPILNKYNCKASFYVITDCIDHNQLTWTHILEHAFLNTKVTAIDLDFSFLPAELKVHSLSNQKERIHYFQKLKPYLRQASHEYRRMIVSKVQESYNDVIYPELMMDWNDLRELKNAGHYIGSHTVSHAVLNTISDDTIVQNELLQSGKTIEKQLGYFPLSLSYPLGKYNEKTIMLCREAGYSMGLIVEQKPYNPSTHSDFEIPRMELYNEKWWKTWMRMNNYIEMIRRKLQ